jgi:alkaline phosphatase D
LARKGRTKLGLDCPGGGLISGMNELSLGPIVGGLSHRRAYLWGRAKADQPGTARLHAWLGQQPDMRNAHLAGTSLPLRSQDGYAGVVPLEGLQADTRYYYALNLKSTTPVQGEGPLPGGSYPCLRTFPAPGESVAFNFAFGSCFRPAEPNSGKIFRALDARRLADDLRFVLLIGDQIYADDFEYNSLGKVAETLDEYRAVYQYVWGWPEFRQLLYNLPAFMILDDHEVDDDWRWIDKNRRMATIPWWDVLMRLLNGRPLREASLPLERVQNALQAFWEHQGMHAPSRVQPLELDPGGRYALPVSDPGSLAYTFEFGLAAFFVLDTRTMRVRPRWGGSRSMLGEGQWQMLQDWLLRVKDTYPVKFLVSSCSLLYDMWIDIPKDRWSGYPMERDRLLHFLAANNIQGLYVLAGDLHSGHAVYAELYAPNGEDLPLWEFCSSPFEQKPNKRAGYTRIKIHNGLLKRQERRFFCAEPNFGVVRVGSSRGGRTSVEFQLFGRSGDLLAET